MEMIRKLQSYASVKGMKVPSSSTASYAGETIGPGLFTKILRDVNPTVRWKGLSRRTRISVVAYSRLIPRLSTAVSSVPAPYV